MDSVTQAVLGGAIQGALLGRFQGRRSLVYGAVLATLPDLDVLLQYADPVSGMTSHRGFSHSVFVLSALAAILAWAIHRRRPDAPYSVQRLFLTLWLVLVTHPLLDAFTIYGTQLFWPLSWTPASWSAVFIVDPVYTLPLLAVVVFAAIKGLSSRNIRLLSCALAFTTAYLFFGLVAGQHAQQRVRTALQAQGVEISQLRAVPTPYNTLVWRTLAKTPDGHYIEAVSGVFDSGPPEWVRHSLGLELASVLKSAPLHQRLRWFTDDWLRYDLIDGSLVVSDLRMGTPGLYTFRFEMARCDDSGQLTPVTPAAWPSRMADASEVRMILRRAVRQQPPLPLHDWAARNEGSNASASTCGSSSVDFSNGPGLSCVSASPP